MNYSESGLKKLMQLQKLIPIAVFGIILSFISCKNDIEKINSFAENLEIPDQSAKNILMEYTDTGKILIRFLAPEVKRYLTKDDPYSEFPQGIEVYFFDNNEKIKTIITAKYSILNQETQLWEARDSVVAKNIQTGEQIDTEQLFWDQPKKFIYSNVFTKITNEDGVNFAERGFEAAQDLSWHRLIGARGKMRVKDEKQPTD
jgi:LPS export ABC transporter protein LptC